MLLTTDEWWDIDGVPLNQNGWNVATLSGRFKPTGMRGEDQPFAYVPGADFREKMPDSRIITFAMWTTGVDNETGLPSTDPVRQWNDNWRRLTKLFWTPSRQLTITRRWRYTDDEGNVAIHTASARGQYISGLEPSMTGRTRATFTVEVKLADPFFYGPEQVITLPIGESITIHNPGDYVAAHKHVFLHLAGAITDPVVTNLTPNPKVWVKYSGFIQLTQAIRLDIERFTAFAAAEEFTYPENDADPNPTNRIANISHAGARPWIGLLPGDNVLRLTGTGNGHAELRFRPPYL